MTAWAQSEDMKRLAPHILVCTALLLSCAWSALGQSNSGTIQGTVVDPSGAVVVGANITIENPVSHYSRRATSDSGGRFEFANIPYNNYHLSASAAGFQPTAQDVDIRSTVPLEVKLNLALGK